LREHLGTRYGPDSNQGHRHPPDPKPPPRARSPPPGSSIIRSPGLSHPPCMAPQPLSNRIPSPPGRLSCSVRVCCPPSTWRQSHKSTCCAGGLSQRVPPLRSPSPSATRRIAATGKWENDARRQGAERHGRCRLTAVGVRLYSRRILATISRMDPRSLLAFLRYDVGSYSCSTPAVA
jgi:hypothetical protein